MVNCSLFWANQRQRWNENPKCWFDCCSNDLFGVYHIQTQCKIDIDKAISHLFCFSFFGRIFVGITTLFVSQLQKRIVFAIACRWDYTHFFFFFYSPCVKKWWYATMHNRTQHHWCGMYRNIWSSLWVWWHHIQQYLLCRGQWGVALDARGVCRLIDWKEHQLSNQKTSLQFVNVF